MQEIMTHEENIKNEMNRHAMVMDGLRAKLPAGGYDCVVKEAAIRHKRSTSLDTNLNEYIPDREVRRTVIEALGSCPPKNRNTAALVKQILIENGLWSSKLLSKKFAEALLQHLTYKTTKDALFQAFYRLNV